MKAVIYVRVSTNEQVFGTSLDSQTKQCIEYAYKKGIQIDENLIFREEGESARLSDRPQLLNMLKYCSNHKGEVTHCIVWKVDRLARKLEVHTIIKAQLIKFGVKLESATEPLTDDPTGNVLEGMLAVFAQFDNEVRTAGTTTGMRERTEQGGWPHDAPPGYRKIRSPSGISTIEPDEKAHGVRQLLEEFSSGQMTVDAATLRSYELGIKTKAGGVRGWQATKNLLSDPKYAGFVKSKYTNGELIRGIHQPLITEEMYYRIQAVLTGNSKTHHGTNETDWPLRAGFLRHICGKPMTGSSPRGNSGPSPRYSCMECRQRVIVAGYPHLMPEEITSTSDCWGMNFTQTQIDRIRQLTVDLNTAVVDAFPTSSGFDYFSTTAAFEGHSTCDDVPYLHDVHLYTNQEYSFHPNETGQGVIAGLIRDALN